MVPHKKDMNGHVLYCPSLPWGMWLLLHPTRTSLGGWEERGMTGVSPSFILYLSIRNNSTFSSDNG